MAEKEPLEKKKKTKANPKKISEEKATEKVEKIIQKEEIKAEEPKKLEMKSAISKVNMDKKMIPVIVAVCAIAIILALGIFVVKGNKKNFLGKPILFVENDQLILWNKDSKKKVVIDDRYDTDDNSYLYATFMNKSNNMVAYVDDSSLYLYDVKKKDADKIASDVSSYIYFSKNDKYVIYQDKDGNIYSYDIKKQDKNKIVSDHDDENNYIVTVTENGVIYRISDEDYNDTLYFYSFGKNAENNKIATVDEYQISEDETKIIYSIEKEENEKAYYIYDLKKKKSDKIINEATGIFSYNKSFNKMYYAKVSEEPGFLDDDEKGKDPTTTSKQLCTYSAYKNGDCSRTDWLYDRYYTATVSKKEVNDSIRKKAITYDIYSYENGKSKKVVNNATSILAANADSGFILYTIVDIEEKVKISSFKTVEEFENYLEKMKFKVFYQKDGGKAITLDIKSEKAFITKNGEGYLLGEDDELYYVNMKKNSSKLEKVDSEVVGMAVYDIGLIYGTDRDENDEEEITMTIKLASGKNGKKLADDVFDINFQDGKLNLYHDCAKDSCNYSVYDKKLKEISKDVYRVVEIDSNNYYEFKNYSSKKETVDLYIRTKGESEKIAYDIEFDYIEYRTED